MWVSARRIGLFPNESLSLAIEESKEQWMVRHSIEPAAIACSAVELSSGAGLATDEGTLARGRSFLIDQFDPNTGAMRITLEEGRTSDRRKLYNPWQLDIVAATMRATAARAGSRRSSFARRPGARQFACRQGLGGQPEEAWPEVGRCRQPGRRLRRQSGVVPSRRWRARPASWSLAVAAGRGDEDRQHR